MIELKQKNNISPLSPHSSEIISEMWSDNLKEDLGVVILFFVADVEKLRGSTIVNVFGLAK